MKNTICLTKNNESWVAQFQGPHAAEIRNLFGTDTIPTAFRSQAAACTVLAAVSARNPGVHVYVA